jgi:predicted nuclease of restriction endonuclease-like (RecB) superfamily
MLLLQAVKDEATRAWYAGQTLAHGWSRNVLKMQIDTAAHLRQGAAITNFAQRLPSPQSDLASQVLKDPYVFDFLTLEAGFHERELETGLVRHVERFLLELGQGFAFVGRQYPLMVGDSDFYIDLLFYHLKLRAFVVIELKRGDFKPEYAGKLNFYCNVVDDTLRHALVQKVWNFCHTLRDDGVGYGDYLEQLTYLLFLKLAHEYAQEPYNRDTHIPQGS